MELKVREGESKEVKSAIDGADIWLTPEVKNQVAEIENSYPYYWGDGELKEAVFRVSHQIHGFLEMDRVDPGSNDILVATDFDGPVNILDSTVLEQLPGDNRPGDVNMHPGFQEAWEFIPYETSVLTSVISNRSVPYLQYWSDNHLGDFLGSRLTLVGEGGATYTEGLADSVSSAVELENIHFTSMPDISVTDTLYREGEGIDISERVGLEREIYRRAADEGRKIVSARKFSPEMVTVSFEGSGLNLEEERTGIWNSDFYAETYGDISIEELWDFISDFEEGEFYRLGSTDAIVFRDSYESAKTLSRVLNYKPAELRFDRPNEGLLEKIPGKQVESPENYLMFTTHPMADEDYTFKDAREDLEAAARCYRERTGNEVELVHNTDWWTDYILGEKTGKESSTEELLENHPRFRPENTVIFYMGDKSTDVYTGDRSYFFAQEGKPAEDAARDKGTRYGVAETSVDYALGIADLMYHVGVTDDSESGS